MVHNRHLALSYRSLAGIEHEHTLLPYTLVAYRRGLYLIAAFEDSGEPRTYALERITRAESKKGTRFTLPKDYSPAAYFGSALFIKPGTPEKVELVFEPGTYDFIRIREFHSSQTLERLPDGHLLMTLEVPAAEDEWEIENFVLSFGKYVEVRSPEHLRQRVAKGLEDALARYR
ncbi:MAG: WYL domain-containing protein [Myxococcota bacterium]|jgi:proteasome accessory factor B|nr:WYL domain-containing protein [Myxococcota bacterium]